MIEYTKCPQCGMRAEALYRNKPKGEKADFVCIHCVPVELQPDDETVMVGSGIFQALNETLEE